MKCRKDEFASPRLGAKDANIRDDDGGPSPGHTEHVPRVAALVVADKAADLKEGVAQAIAAIDSGRAMDRLNRLRALARPSETLSP